MDHSRLMKILCQSSATPLPHCLLEPDTAIVYTFQHTAGSSSHQAAACSLKLGNYPAHSCCCVVCAECQLTAHDIRHTWVPATAGEAEPTLVDKRPSFVQSAGCA
jgi:hypothetical protein